MDLFLKVDRMPGRGEKVRAKEIGKLPGGIIGNFCSQAVKMGVSCGIVTAVGKDDYGRFLKEDYKNRGIDITGLYEDEKENTFYCVVFLDGSGEKYLSAVVSPLTSPDIRRIDYDYVRQAAAAVTAPPSGRRPAVPGPGRAASPRRRRVSPPRLRRLPDRAPSRRRTPWVKEPRRTAARCRFRTEWLPVCTSCSGAPRPPICP